MLLIEGLGFADYVGDSTTYGQTDLHEAAILPSLVPRCLEHYLSNTSLRDGVHVGLLISHQSFQFA